MSVQQINSHQLFDNQKVLHSHVQAGNLTQLQKLVEDVAKEPRERTSLLFATVVSFPSTIIAMIVDYSTVGMDRLVNDKSGYSVITYVNRYQTLKTCTDTHEMTPLAYAVFKLSRIKSYLETCYMRVEMSKTKPIKDYELDSLETQFAKQKQLVSLLLTCKANIYALAYPPKVGGISLTILDAFNKLKNEKNRFVSTAIQVDDVEKAFLRAIPSPQAVSDHPIEHKPKKRQKLETS